MYRILARKPCRKRSLGKPGNVGCKDERSNELAQRHVQITIFRFCINASKPYLLRHGVGIAMGYGLDGRGSIPGRSKRFFSFPQCPDRLWGQPSLLSNGYWGLFPWG
jgi:hypothetical protein